MQSKTYNIFYHKFKSLNDDELIIVAKSNIKYTLDARNAAITILKERNVKSQHIQDVENELSNFRDYQLNLINSKKIEDKKIVQFLVTNLPKGTIEMPLNNENGLQVKKISDRYYQIRIEHYGSVNTPVVILKVDDHKNITYFPFFYSFPFHLFLILSIISIGYFYYVDNKIPVYWLKCLGFLLLFTIAIQLLLMPFKYKSIVKKFKNKILQ